MNGLCTNDPMISDTFSVELGEVGGREFGGRAIFWTVSDQTVGRIVD